MNFEEYICLIKRRLNKSCNTFDDIEENGVKINLYANSFFLSEKIFHNRILPFLNYEIVENYYLKHFENFKKEDLQNYYHFLHLIANKKSSSYNHVQKSVIGVLICDNIDESSSNYIKNLKYSKPFKLYSKGWSEIQLIIVDLSKRNLFFNNAAKEKSQIFSFEII